MDMFVVFRHGISLHVDGPNVLGLHLPDEFTYVVLCRLKNGDE